MDDFDETSGRILRALAFAAATAPGKNHQEFALALEDFKKSVAMARALTQVIQPERAKTVET